MTRVARFAMLLIAPLVAFADTPGSADHPIITRFPGSEIAAYGVHDFSQYKIPLGPVTGYRAIGAWSDTVEGKVTRIFYHLPAADRSLLEVHRNFANALERGGFDVLAEGSDSERNVGKDIGGRSWLQVVYTENGQTTEGETVNLLTGSATVGGSAYVAGHLKRAEGDVYVAVCTTEYSKEQIAIMVDVVEVAPMDDGLVFIDADAMSKGIDADGKIALYGIFFEHDSATITPDSKPTLDEIAKLMNSRADLNVYIVGHTDMTGGLDYNMKLSADRAASVVSALDSEYSIATSRMTAKGVGPLSPVATNQNETGRGRNRRVELVAK